MFGYVIVNKPELKIKELDRYQAFYCGLCHALKDKFGIRGQMALNYDLTFAAVLLSALYEPEEEKKRFRCIAHPWSAVHHRCVTHPMEQHSTPQACCMISNEMVDYAADMDLILTWYKCKDDWRDDKKVGKGIYAAQLAKRCKRLELQYEEKAANIRAGLDVLNQLEADQCVDIDKLSGTFGKILAEVFTVKPDEWERELYRMGFYLGKFIYILDAYDDLEEDKKKGGFNPFLQRSGEDGFEEWLHEILVMAAAETAKSFEILPVVQDAELLRNIIYAGIWTKYYAAKERRKLNAGSLSGAGHTKERNR